MLLKVKSQFYNSQRVILVDSNKNLVNGIISIIDNGLIFFCSNCHTYSGLSLKPEQKFGMLYSWVLSFDKLDIILGNYKIYTEDTLTNLIPNNILFSKYKFLI